MKTCSRCKREKPLDAFVSFNVDRPGETRKCATCRGVNALRKRTFSRTTLCGVPRCQNFVDEGSPLCTAHNRTPQAGLWYALSCLTCGRLEHYRLTTFQRAYAIIPPCPRCRGFCELTEDRQGVGGPNGSRITTSWCDDAA